MENMKKNRTNPKNFRKSVKPRTFQELSDFCKLNETFNVYHNIPEYSHSMRDEIYYHRALNSQGLTRAGTYIYGTSLNELHRFMGHTPECVRVHIDTHTFKEVNFQKLDAFDNCIYITAYILNGKGVQIRYEDPFQRSSETLFFYPRSHRSFDKEGVIAEVVDHIKKHYYYPPGRYHDLQVKYKILKKDFNKWYLTEYKEMVKYRNDQDYYHMLNRYTPQKSPIDYDEARDMLWMSGAFSDFGAADEYEQDEMTYEFLEYYNR